MLKRWGFAIGAMILLLVIMLPGCAKQAAPAPTAVEHEVVPLRIYSTSFGTVGYILSFAVADVLNKKHPWLRAQTIETLSSFVATQTVADDPKLRSSAFVDNFTLKMYEVINGLPPMKRPITDLKFLFQYGPGGHFYLTLDPKIKYPQDLIGKKIMAGDPAVLGPYPEALLRAMGIFDKVTILHGSTAKSKDSLLDGLVDVAVNSMTYGGGVYAPSSAMQEMCARGAHPVYVPRNVVEKLLPLFPVCGVEEFPAGSWPNQTEAFSTYVGNKCYTCYPELPDEVAYEIVKTADKYAREFDSYHVAGKGINHNELASILGFGEKDFHPGAVKYYKEQGIVMGK